MWRILGYRGAFVAKTVTLKLGTVPFQSRRREPCNEFTWTFVFLKFLNHIFFLFFLRNNPPKQDLPHAKKYTIIQTQGDQSSELLNDNYIRAGQAKGS